MLRFFFFKETAKLFSRVSMPFFILTKLHEIQFSVSLSSFDVVTIFSLSPSIRYVVISHCGFYNSLVASIANNMLICICKRELLGKMYISIFYSYSFFLNINLFISIEG